MRQIKQIQGHICVIMYIMWIVRDCLYVNIQKLSKKECMVDLVRFIKCLRYNQIYSSGGWFLSIQFVPAGLCETNFALMVTVSLNHSQVTLGCTEVSTVVEAFDLIFFG